MPWFMFHTTPTLSSCIQSKCSGTVSVLSSTLSQSQITYPHVFSLSFPELSHCVPWVFFMHTLQPVSCVNEAGRNSRTHSASSLPVYMLHCLIWFHVSYIISKMKLLRIFKMRVRKIAHLGRYLLWRYTGEASMLWCLCLLFSFSFYLRKQTETSPEW